MKFFNQSIVAVLLMLIIGCQSPVLFTEPQPKGESELSMIPTEYQGIYWCEIDSIALIVDEKLIIKQKEYESVIPIDEMGLNPTLTFQNHRLFSNEMNQSFPAKIVGDNIVSRITIRDTLYSKTTGQILKFYKGHLILNNPLDNIVWDVAIMSLKQHDVLSFSRANMPDNLEELEQITPVTEFRKGNSENIFQIKITPTKGEFDQILKQKLVFDGACIEFKRIFPISEPPLTEPSL